MCTKQKEDAGKRRRGLNGGREQDRIIEYRNLLYKFRSTVYLEKGKKAARKDQDWGEK